MAKKMKTLVRSMEKHNKRLKGQDIRRVVQAEWFNMLPHTIIDAGRQGLSDSIWIGAACVRQGEWIWRKTRVLKEGDEMDGQRDLVELSYVRTLRLRWNSADDGATPRFFTMFPILLTSLEPVPTAMRD